jgi:hypothetical protein
MTDKEYFAIEGLKAWLANSDEELYFDGIDHIHTLVNLVAKLEALLAAAKQLVTCDGFDHGRYDATEYVEAHDAMDAALAALKEEA